MQAHRQLQQVPVTAGACQELAAPRHDRLQSTTADSFVQSSGSDGLLTCKEGAQAGLQSRAATHMPAYSAQGAVRSAAGFTHIAHS